MTLKTKLESVFGDSDERAVSPVIGVILMVAITVILAAVIATFVLDLGGEQKTNLNAGVTFSDKDGGGATATLTSLGNAESVEIRKADGTVVGSAITKTGATVDIPATAGTVSAVAIKNDQETVVQTYDVPPAP